VINLLKHGGTQGLPAIEINENNCDDLIISLENAPAIPGNKPNTTNKDKRSEKSKTTPQEHATFSDTLISHSSGGTASKSSDSSNKTMIEALLFIQRPYNETKLRVQSVIR
jgi:hypothetical protein